MKEYCWYHFSLLVVQQWNKTHKTKGDNLSNKGR